MHEMEHLSVPQVATILNVSRDTVIRRFENEPGVIDMGTTEKQHKRRRRILRIPRYVLNRVVNKRTIT
jgi:hypothetical protein